MSGAPSDERSGLSGVAPGTFIPSRCLGNVFTASLPRELFYQVVSPGTCLQSRCPGNGFTEALPRERVYQAVAPETFLPSRCPGNVFPEPLPWERVYRAVSAGTFLSSRCPGNFGDDMDTRKECVCRPSLRCAVVRVDLLYHDGILNTYHRSNGLQLRLNSLTPESVRVLLGSRPTMRLWCCYAAGQQCGFGVATQPANNAG
jgi:hypothetical protein